MTEEVRGARRTIYLTDRLWRLVRSKAAAEGRTVSEVIEESLAVTLAGLSLRDLLAREKQQERSFTEFRPAPKPGKRK